MSLSPIEVIGFVTGVGCVWLAARENIWNWPVAIVNALSYIIVPHFLRVSVSPW